MNSSKFFVVCFCSLFGLDRAQNTSCVSANQKTVHGRGPSNINIDILLYSFDVCRAS